MLVQFLLRLYPGAWRARYGDELRALLEDVPITPSVAFDLARAALGARASLAAAAPDPSLSTPHGGLPMRARAVTLASLLSFALVLPAVAFFGAALIRGMQPGVHEPARTAQAVVDAFAQLPGDAHWILILLAPVVAAVLAAAVITVRLATDATARADVAALGAGLRRVARQPALVIAVLALLASLGTIAFVVDHAIAG